MHQRSISFFSFRSLAKVAKANGLLVGFSTNGYFTPKALAALIPYTDFVNVGVKGFSDERYRPCGAPSAAPVFRNMEQLFESGVHVEVAAIYMKGGEDEVRRIARFVGSLSKDIPLQVMRFVPFGEALMAFEPTTKASEILCRELKETLPYVYLFNAPGSALLNTSCPDCGRTVVEREFFGPMGARTIRVSMADTMCHCGRKIDIKGRCAPERYNEHGFFGGYRTTRAFEMLHGIMVCIGADTPEALSTLWFHLIESDYLKAFHDLVQQPEAYGRIIDDVAKCTGREEDGRRLKRYIEEKLHEIQSRTQGVMRRPTVYYAMGYPLFALNPQRFETNLVQAAGGTCVNKQLTQEGKPGFPAANAEADAYGVELEAGALLSDNLSLYGSFSYNRFYFSQDIHNSDGSINPVDGRQVPDAPEYLCKGSLSYRLGKFVLSPIVKYTSSRYGDIGHDEKIDDNVICDFDVTYMAGPIPGLGVKNFDVSLTFDNLFDEEYISIINTSDYKTLGSSYQSGAPFTVYASVALNF